jgi:alanyl-tRNA synthetase
VEETANRVLWEDREVCVQFVTAAEAARLSLRKDPARSGQLRIIEIKDYDHSACGGTHVRRTGAIGIVVIAGFERFKGGLRVEFVCGYRALTSYRTLKAAVAGGVRVLSVLPDELPAAIERLQAANKSQQKAQDAVYERLAVHEGAALAATGEKIGTLTVVATTVKGWDLNGLKKLASAIVSRPSTVAVLLTSDVPSPIVVARSEDVAFDAGVVLRSLIERFGGKGGGKGALAQGGGVAGNPDDVLAAAREQIKSIV